MKQLPSSEELHRQAVPVIRDLVKAHSRHCGNIPIDAVIYATVRHLALTIAIKWDHDPKDPERIKERREWIGVLMDQFLEEFCEPQTQSLIASYDPWTRSSTP